MATDNHNNVLREPTPGAAVELKMPKCSVCKNVLMDAAKTGRNQKLLDVVVCNAYCKKRKYAHHTCIQSMAILSADRTYRFTCNACGLDRLYQPRVKTPRAIVRWVARLVMWMALYTLVPGYVVKLTRALPSKSTVSMWPDAEHVVLSLLVVTGMYMGKWFFWDLLRMKYVAAFVMAKVYSGVMEIHESDLSAQRRKS